MADSPQPSPADLTFAHYEVRQREDGLAWELGRGAMGVTYKAYDPRLRVEVALKIINPAQIGHAKTRALFLREARAAARIHQSNVASVVYLHEDPTNPFYAMEFIAGESLRDWLHPRAPLEPLLAIGLALQIAHGLEAIHRENVIHRDLKPTNLMVVRADVRRKESDPDAWQVKIIDFGLAKRLTLDVTETSGEAATLGFRGTALYASPEQCEERRDLDGRSDLYSLGCVMWEMLVGAPPFRAGVHRELLNAHVAKPPPVQQLSHLPGGLQSVLARLLVKDRDARFADAGAVIKALEGCREQIRRGDGPAPSVGKETAETHAPTTVMPPVAEPAHVARTSRRGLVAAATAALVLVGALLSWKGGWLGVRAGEMTWEAPVVAILPFDSDGGKEETKLAEALTNEVTNRVAQLPGTRVISRGAVMAYKTVPGGPARKRVRTIDAELSGVSAVLETSVDRKGDELKINAVLYDAKTEQRLWGQTYRRDWRDATGVEKELPEQITRALRTRLAARKRETPADRAAPGPTAADLYFQAVPMDPFLKERKALLDQAVTKDPKFAEAMAESTAYDSNIGFTQPNLTPQEQTEKKKAAEEMNRKALALDPDCVPAHVYLWMFLGDRGAKKEADPMIARALELAPNDFRANVFAGFQADEEGRPVDAYAFYRRAHVIDPDLRRILNDLFGAARTYQLSELADHWLRKMSELTRDLQMQELIAIQRLMVRGDFNAALDRLQLLPIDLEKDHFRAAQMTYEALIGAGKYEAALALSEKLGDDPVFQDLTRAETLFRLGRVEEARQAAARLVAFQDEAIKKSKAQGQPVRMGYLRLAKGLEILGRQAEALAQIDSFVQLPWVPESNWDLAVFRGNPAVLERLQKRLEKDKLIAKRILEIEKSYSEPGAGTKLR